MERYRVMAHTADVGIIGYGGSLPEAFANAALGMFDQILDLAGVQEATTWTVEVEGEGPSDVLVRWLNELLFIFDTEALIPCRIEVSHLDDRRLRATLWGEPLDPKRHRLKGEVKAATYHGAEVVQGPQPRVQVILDV